MMIGQICDEGCCRPFIPQPRRGGRRAFVDTEPTISEGLPIAGQSDESLALA
jgi:hypothetical protein